MNGADDILFRLGIDNKAFVKGLTRAKQEVAGFQSALGKIGVAISAGVLVGAGRRLVQWGDDLKSAATNLDVSTDYLQKFRYALELTSGSAADAQANLGRMVKFISDARTGEERATKVMKDYGLSLENQAGELRNTEEMIAAISDRFMELGDSTARSGLGFEIFGKKGYEMAGAMSAGSVELKKLMDQASGRIMSKEAIDSLDEMSNSIEILKGQMAGGLSTLHNWVVTAAQYYGAISGGANTDQNILQTFKGIEQIKNSQANKDKQASEARRLDELKWTEIQKEQAEQWKKDDAEWTRAKEKENALEEKSIALSNRKLDLEKRLTDMQQRKVEAMGDRSRFSLGELAGLRPGGRTTREMRGDIRAARQVTWLESRARKQAALGYFDTSQETLSMADKIRGGIGALQASDRHQWRSMAEDTAETRAQITELVNRAKREGLRFIPVNGP